MVQFQQRRGTAANLASANEVPAAGQIIFEYDTNKMKVGDGETAYNSLQYLVSDNFVLTTDSRLSDARTPTSHTHNDLYYTETEVNSLLSGKSATSHNHDDLYFTQSEIATLLAGKSSTSHDHAGVYATLVNGTVPLSQLPSTGVTDGDKGDITVASGTWTIDDNAVTSTKIADGAVTYAKLASTALRVGTLTGLPVKTSGSGVLAAGAFGTASGSFAQGNDVRFAKAYVRFDGTNLTVGSSYNVSSVTSAATGQYTVTFTSAITTSYVAIAMARTYGLSAGTVTSDISSTANATVEVRCYSSYSGQIDNPYICVVVF